MDSLPLSIYMHLLNEICLMSCWISSLLCRLHLSQCPPSIWHTCSRQTKVLSHEFTFSPSNSISQEICDIFTQKILSTKFHMNKNSVFQLRGSNLEFFRLTEIVSVTEVEPTYSFREGLCFFLMVITRGNSCADSLPVYKGVNVYSQYLGNRFVVY